LYQEAEIFLAEFGSSYLLAEGQRSNESVRTAAMQELWSWFPDMHILKTKATVPDPGKQSQAWEATNTANAIVIRPIIPGPIVAGVMYGIFHWVLKLMRVA